jgi:hypothetical protein
MRSGLTNRTPSVTPATPALRRQLGKPTLATHPDQTLPNGLPIPRDATMDLVLWLLLIR